jgi:hypothetical protein
MLRSKSEIKIISLYILLFSALLFLINKFFMPGILASANFLNWDAEHYSWIKDNGYEGFRVAFFPLFPLFWKLLNVSPPLISIVNALIFFISLYVLAKQFKPSVPELILLLSIPGCMFFYLPYTESIFFASSTLILAGLKQQKTGYTLTGLFLCTLARPAFTVFIPALIIVECLSMGNIKQILQRIGMYLVACGAGIGIVALVQHNDTGEWFKFFAAQKMWGNELQLPKLPFTSWAGGLIVRLDGTAMLIGLSSGILLLLYMIRKNTSALKSFPPELIFSLAYLSGITLSVILFRGGSLFSLNRFVLASAFIFVAVDYYLKQDFNFNVKQILICLSVLMIYWLSFGSYVHILTLLKFLLISIYLTLFICIKSENKLVGKYSLLLFAAINFTFQGIFFFRFLNGEWIG